MDWTLADRRLAAGGPVQPLGGRAIGGVLFRDVSLWLAAFLDVGFFLVLGLLAAREVLEANNRNTPVISMILLFGLADGLDYLANTNLIPWPDLGWQLAIALIVLLISLIGGRIIPSFTRNWLVKRGMTSGLPTQPGKFDLFVIGATAVAMLFWLLGPAELATGLVLCAAGAAGGPLVAVAGLAYACRPSRR